MDDRIVSFFKQGDFAGGIVSGVESLDYMVRGKPLPPRPWPSWCYPLFVGCCGLGAFTLVSLVRSGRDGWAWAFWYTLLSLPYRILRALFDNSNNDPYTGSAYRRRF